MAHQTYRVDGEKVPSVTTILGGFKESGGLVHWAWKLGSEGEDYRVERDSAAEAGTCAHAMAEAYIRKETFDPDPYLPETLEKAKIAFQGFLEWAENSKLQPAHTETALVSRKYRFGGCLDAMFINAKLAVADWKTSNGIYPEMLCQVAAYGKLWEENFPEQPIEGGYHIVRFDKNHGDFSHHWYPNLDEAWRYFLLVREAYDIRKLLKKRCQ